MVGREPLANQAPPARRALVGSSVRKRSVAALLGVPVLLGTAGWAAYTEPWKDAGSTRPPTTLAGATSSPSPSTDDPTSAAPSTPDPTAAAQTPTPSPEPQVLPTGAITAAEASVNPLPALPRDCHSAPSWALKAPTNVTRPADGIVARTWDGTSYFGAPLRLVAVQADFSKVAWSVSTAGHLGTTENTKVQTEKSGGAVGLNGDFFVWGPTGEIPFGVQVVGGEIRFAPAGATRAIGLGDDGKFHYAYVHVDGAAQVTGADGAAVKIPIGSVNVSPTKAVSLVTAYGSKQPFHASWYVLVRDGVVVSSSPRDPGGPSGKDQLLLAPTSKPSLLSGVKAGSKAVVQAALKSDYGITFSQAIGSGSEMLRDSRYVGPGCGSQYGFYTRPRTMVAWNAKDGRFWLFSAQSTGTGAFHPGNRGLSYSETSDLLRRLGATDAVPLDGGGSTTLIFKSSNGLTRVDGPSSYPQRPIPDVMVLTPRT